MAEKWRRCDSCRKVKPVEDFDEDRTGCIACSQPKPKPARTRASAVTVTRPSAAASGSSTAAVGYLSPNRDLRGRGDAEVRSRRARVRALDKLADLHADEFATLLAEERRAEGL